MHGSTGSPDDPPGPPGPSGPPPSTEEDPDGPPVRISFTKAPLVVLGGVMGVLLAVLTAQVLLAEGDGGTVVTQAAGTRQEPTQDNGSNNDEQTDPPDPSPTALDPGPSSNDEAGSQEPGDPAGEGSRAEGTVSRSIEQMDDPAYVADRITEGFAHDFRGVIDRTEARCMAEVVIGMFGIDRLWQITHAMADANADSASFNREDPRLLSDAEADQLNAQLRGCVSQEAANRLNLE